jgi:Domain of unknown function (DUF3870)
VASARIRHVPSLPYVLVAGYAQLPQTTGAGVMWRHLTIIARVEIATHRVTDVSTTLATPVADAFVRDLMLGLDLREGTADFVHTVETHYFGNGRKAIVGAFRDLVRRYEDSLEHRM